MKKLIPSIFLILLITSCSLLGFNMKKQAARKAARYPVFTEKDSLLGYLNSYRSCFDVCYYKLNIDFNIKQKSIKGSVDIYFTAIKNLDTIQLNLRDNMKLSQIQFENSNLNFTRKLDAVFVAFNRNIRANEKIKIRIFYEGKPLKAPRPPWEGGFVWKKDKLKNPWVGVACENIGANIWWPLKDHNTDEPDSVSLNFTVPLGLICVSNGKLFQRILNSNKTETFCWNVSAPINTYNISFYIGAFEHFSIPFDLDKGRLLNFYVLGNNLETAKEHFKQSKEIIQFYEKIYGEYPFWQDGYKLIESPYAGMEHQTAIAYGNNYKNNAEGFDYIILHETAHEWWGNAVSVGDYADIWIHEGFATYSEALFLEDKYGYERYMNYLSFYSILIDNKKPVVGPRSVNYWDYKDSDPYLKGALMLHSLRGTIGNDEVFFDILKSFYQKYKFTIVNSSNFIELVNEKTKSNYKWFFQQFLYNRKPARLQYKTEFNPVKNSWNLRYKWLDTDSDFKMPIDIKDGWHIKRLYPTTEEMTYEIQTIKYFSVNNQSFYFTLYRVK